MISKLVGGNLEGLAVADGNWCGYINKDGGGLGLPPNPMADAMARVLGYPFMHGDYLQGVAVFLGIKPGKPAGAGRAAIRDRPGAAGWRGDHAFRQQPLGDPVTAPEPAPDDGGRVNPKAVRLPKGSNLLAYYQRHASDTGVSVNAALVLALRSSTGRPWGRRGA